MSRPRSGPSLFADLPPFPDFSLESTLLRDGHSPVCGVDEAGRGPLAGPVMAAAVILDPDRLPVGIDDSKRMNAAGRTDAFARIMESARAVSFASVAAEAIDA
ncbi:MAG: ribonuclease HII, partial [Rhizobiaceae bacterium]